MMISLKKIAIISAVIAVTTAGLSTSASARLPNQKSLGGGVKCFSVPITQADGSVVFTQICRKGP